jgi:hypothetical protein
MIVVSLQSHNFPRTAAKMHHTGVFLVITASVAAAAKFSNTEFGTISAGSPIVLTWFDASSPVTIKLKNGASAALNDVSTIGSKLNSKFQQKTIGTK